MSFRRIPPEHEQELQSAPADIDPFLARLENWRKAPTWWQVFSNKNLPEKFKAVKMFGGKKTWDQRIFLNSVKTRSGAQDPEPYHLDDFLAERPEWSNGPEAKWDREEWRKLPRPELRVPEPEPGSLRRERANWSVGRGGAKVKNSLEGGPGGTPGFESPKSSLVRRKYASGRREDFLVGEPDSLTEKTAWRHQGGRSGTYSPVR